MLQPYVFCYVHWPGPGWDAAAASWGVARSCTQQGSGTQPTFWTSPQQLPAGQMQCCWQQCSQPSSSYLAASSVLLPERGVWSRPCGAVSASFTYLHGKGRGWQTCTASCTPSCMGLREVGALNVWMPPGLPCTPHSKGSWSWRGCVRLEQPSRKLTGGSCVQPWSVSTQSRLTSCRWAPSGCEVPMKKCMGKPARRISSCRWFWCACPADQGVKSDGWQGKSARVPALLHMTLLMQRCVCCPQPLGHLHVKDD